MMDFYAVLDQIRDLLQRRRRVTYRALKVQFQLDDEHLEALTEELIDAEGVATDEQGKVLVWTGGAGAPMQPAPPTPASAAQEDQPLQAAASSAASTTSEAERRQLTVLFCDLADSTRLARHLDPEDLRDVIRAYQTTCVAVIQRFAGHVAQYLGDGLLVYFGYPQAHEDDAQRAVRTGLGILQAMGTLNAGLVQDKGVRLTVRLGIHTGRVVVGEMGSGDRHEHLALGDTPNLAARLQGLAAPDTVVISAATARLAQGVLYL
jgi:class 3 adenylate cyclase